MLVLRKSLGLLLLLGLFAPITKTQAAPNTAKVFVLTSSYGVMAGSLTGLASLAFYGSPGDHLRNVAIGASLGLYMGIFLGAYLLYLQPDPNAPKKTIESSGETEEEARAVLWTPTFAYTPSTGSQIGIALLF
jgi:hypothetical protein